LEVDELVADVSKSAHFFWRYKYLTESNQHVIYQLSSEQPKSYEASLIELRFAMKKCSACTTARKSSISTGQQLRFSTGRLTGTV